MASARTARAAPRSAIGGHTEEGGDRDFVPDVELREGDAVKAAAMAAAGMSARSRRPGHTSNHLCFALHEESTLFTGDHVMGWSTSVISPPDGDMAAYMRSLDKLLRARATRSIARRTARRSPSRKPFVQAFIAHRNERSDAILKALAAGDETIPAIVARGLCRARSAACRRRPAARCWRISSRWSRPARVICDGPPSLEARYRLA